MSVRHDLIIEGFLTLTKTRRASARRRRELRCVAAMVILLGGVLGEWRVWMRVCLFRIGFESVWIEIDLMSGDRFGLSSKHCPKEK